MTRTFQDPDDHSKRVDDVVARAGALSDELRDTISELTKMLRAEPKGETSAGRPTD